MTLIRKPDFFVVGAPKSGTTSLYYYLKAHPQVFLPRRKELLFFCDDLHFNFPLLSEEQFLNYYRDAGDKSISGEVSVWNLFSRSAAQKIFDLNPDSRIIILLRNPVDMLYALHSNHVFNDNEIIADFEEALSAEEDRKKGKRISPVIKGPVEGLYYSEIVKYAEQVQRYYEVFAKEKVKVILFDDFIVDTKRVFTDLLRFLEVDESYKPEFKTHNASKTVKSSALKKFTIDPPSWLKRIGRKIFPHQSKRRDVLMHLLWKINTREELRKALAPELRFRLIQEFTPGIRKLEKVIDRDLSAWL